MVPSPLAARRISDRGRPRRRRAPAFRPEPQQRRLRFLQRQRDRAVQRAARILWKKSDHGGEVRVRRAAWSPVSMRYAFAILAFTAFSATRGQTPAGAIVSSLPPGTPLPPEAASAGVERFSFITYGDTRG